jgi:hypothetical protein
MRKKLRTLSKARLRTSWPKHRPIKGLIEDLLADRPTSLADDGLFPLSVLRLVNRMIVSPGKKQQQSEDRAGNQGEERQGSRRHSRRVRCDGVDVKHEPARKEKHQNGPPDDLEIRPFRRWGQFLGKGRLLSPPGRRPTHNQVWPSAADRDCTQPRPAFTSEETFLIG